MAIKLYASFRSANCERVKIALQEKGLTYDIVQLDLKKKDQKRPDFLKLNPYGKVPVIDDGGTVLFESCVINEYLDEKYPNPPLMPKDAHGRGRVRNLVDYGLYFTHSAFRALRDEMLKEDAESDLALVEKSREVLRGLLRYLEKELEGKNYFLCSFETYSCLAIRCMAWRNGRGTMDLNASTSGRKNMTISTTIASADASSKSSKHWKPT